MGVEFVWRPARPSLIVVVRLIAPDELPAHGTFNSGHDVSPSARSIAPLSSATAGLYHKPQPEQQRRQNMPCTMTLTMLPVRDMPMKSICAGSAASPRISTHNAPIRSALFSVGTLLVLALALAIM